ncbi:hypothetical protein DKP78_24870, partial [Enterococcus faecium]
GRNFRERPDRARGDEKGAGTTMTPFQARRDAGYPVRSLAAAVLVVIAGAIVAVPPATAEASRPLDQVYPITIDATALVS